MAVTACSQKVGRKKYPIVKTKRHLLIKQAKENKTHRKTKFQLVAITEKSILNKFLSKQKIKLNDGVLH
jgi:hypothetical protein